MSLYRVRWLEDPVLPPIIGGDAPPQPTPDQVAESQAASAEQLREALRPSVNRVGAAGIALGLGAAVLLFRRRR